MPTCVARHLVAIALAGALVDHLLRARARAARLDVETSRRTPPPTRDAVPAWLDRSDTVVFDDSGAVAMAGDEVIARATGLEAVAMRELARVAGRRVRQGGLPA